MLPRATLLRLIAHDAEPDAPEESGSTVTETAGYRPEARLTRRMAVGARRRSTHADDTTPTSEEPP